MRLGATRAKEKKKGICRAPRVRFPRRFPSLSPRSLPGENNENIDPRENDDTLSRRFPGPGDLHRLHSRRRRQATRVFRREQLARLLTPGFSGAS